MYSISSDYDSAWKEALNVYFEPFMALCFPEAFADIDWARGYETLDTELQEITRDAETGRRLADKLVKVWLTTGEETFVLVHIEIQGQSESDFAQRMYIYNHRLFDRYNREVISFAVLGDDELNWRPAQYGYSRWRFRSQLEFPSVKLLDYQQQWSELEQSTNPFATIIMAHLKTLATRGNFPERKQWKFSLVRGLYERGYSRDQIRQLFRFIEWIMALPAELQREFKADIQRYEEERKMTFITSFERDGIEIGLQQGLQEGLQQGLQQGLLQATRNSVIEVLETRFSQLPASLIERLNQIEDIPTLKQLLKQAITVASLEEFERNLSSTP